MLIVEMAPLLPAHESFERYRSRLQWRLAVLLWLLFVPLLLAVAAVNVADTRYAAAGVSALAVLALAAFGWVSWRQGPEAGGRRFFAGGAGVVASLPVLGWLLATDMHFWFYLLPALLPLTGVGRWLLPLALGYAVLACVCLLALLPVGDVLRFGASYLFLSLLMGTFAFLMDRAQQVQRYYSEHDELTGCLNRRSFNGWLGRVQGTGSVGLILLDVDDFKSINDRFGHAAGDEVLARVAALLGECLDGEQRLFRYGGEEFAVLVERAEPAAVVKLAERLRRAVQDAEPTPLAVTLSAGVAIWHASRESALAAIDAADRALYESKRQGKNRVVSAG